MNPHTIEKHLRENSIVGDDAIGIAGFINDYLRMISSFNGMRLKGITVRPVLGTEPHEVNQAVKRFDIYRHDKIIKSLPIGDING